MNISKQQIDEVSAVLTVELAPTDYENKVQEALKKVQRQASMPGFRPGKVPPAMVKKMYGKSVLADEVNKILNDSIYDFINKENIEILGNPLPKATNQVDWDTQKEFKFEYELGLAPAINVEISDKTTIDYAVVKVDDALIDKYVKDVRRNYGKPSNPEVSAESDVVFVDINELDTDGNIVPGGIFKSTSIGIDRQKNEEVKKQLTGLKRDDKVVFHCKELYENPIDMSIALGIDKETAAQLDCKLQLTVKNIARMEDAELNQELFDRLYGAGAITSEEAFRNKIREELNLMFAQDSDRKFMQDAETYLLEKLNPKLPEDFLKRWILAVNDKPITMEQIEGEFASYARDTKWKLIENKIIKQYDLKVTPEEGMEEAKRFVRSQYARYGQTPEEKDVENLAKSIMSKQQEAEKVYENLFKGKLLELFKNNFKLNKKEVSYNEFFGIKE